MACEQGMQECRVTVCRATVETFLWILWPWNPIKWQWHVTNNTHTKSRLLHPQSLYCLSQDRSSSIGVGILWHNGEKMQTWIRLILPWWQLHPCLSPVTRQTKLVERLLTSSYYNAYCVYDQVHLKCEDVCDLLYELCMSPTPLLASVWLGGWLFIDKLHRMV